MGYEFKCTWDPMHPMQVRYQAAPRPARVALERLRIIFNPGTVFGIIPTP